MTFSDKPFMDKMNIIEYYSLSSILAILSTITLIRLLMGQNNREAIKITALLLISNIAMIVYYISIIKVKTS